MLCPSRVVWEDCLQKYWAPTSHTRTSALCVHEGNWGNPKLPKYEKVKIIKYNADGLPMDEINDEKGSKE